MANFTKNEPLHWNYLTTGTEWLYWGTVFCTTPVFVEYLLVVVITSASSLFWENNFLIILQKLHGGICRVKKAGLRTPEIQLQ